MTDSVNQVGLRPAAKATVTSIELDGEVVVYDLGTGRLHRLDRIAGVIWGCLDGSGTVEEIVADLADGFGADPAQVERDVQAVLRHLAEEELLVGEDGTDGSEDEPDPAHDGTVVLTDPPSP